MTMNKLIRLIKHLWLDADDTRRAIPPDMLQRLAGKVAASERHHSGQIRICVESSLPASYLWRLNKQNTLSALTRQRAITMFGKLRVWDTEFNNGVLIYVLLAEHAIEIIADRGLMRYVDGPQWQAMISRMASAFRENHYEEGLIQALEETSAVLITHFPRPNNQALDGSETYPNELPDLPLLR